MSESLSILVVGHATHDRFGSGFVPGGCVYYAGQAYRAFGARVRVATTVGEDFAFADEAFEGLEVLAERAGKTTLFTNLYPEQGRRIQILEASAPPVVPEMLDVRHGQVDLLHLAPVFGEVSLSAWKEAVQARLVAISVQGWLREVGPGHADGGGRAVISRRWEPTPNELEGVDVACLSEDDLVGQPGLLELLKAHIPIVALTHGGDGCDVYLDDQHHHVGVFSTRTVDPTGAGDVFAAGFLFQLARGADPIEAARFGAGAASIIIEGIAGAALGGLSKTAERVHEISRNHL
ncbi:MAG: PfkB family carbohydrate kinase [Bradymonadaceae bacterium]